jgi:GDP-L-fucose synthase
MISKDSSIFIAGHKGMVGSSILRCFLNKGFSNVLIRNKKELDLRIQKEVDFFFKSNKIDCVILAAAKVGGIQANINYPADFFYDNLLIQTNVIYAAKNNNVKKIIFLGSSCIYPAACPQPMKEKYLLSGPLEPTNEGYALAKVTGIKMLKAFNTQYGLESLTIIPPNLYGPNDSFDLENCHVLSALVKRFLDAKTKKWNEITLWGTGIARREFMHVDDIAEAVYFLLNQKIENDILNIGHGKDISIKELAMIIAQKTNFSGEILWDTSKPNGMLKKCMDVSKMEQINFVPKINLKEGIDQMIEEYKKIQTL